MDAETIFLVEINYIVIFFLTITGKPRLLGPRWKTSVYKRPLADESEPVSVTATPWFRNPPLPSLSPWPHRGLSVPRQSKGAAQVPRQRLEGLETSPILVRVWSFPVRRDTATHLFAEGESLLAVPQSVRARPSVTTGEMHTLVKTKARNWLCCKHTPVFSKF